MKSNKLIALLCATAMLLLFTACDNEKNKEDKSSSEATSSSAEITEREETKGNLYSENPTDLSLLIKYEEMLGKAEEMDEAFEEWDNSEMNDDEMKYYLEVTNRIYQNLIDVTL